MITRRSNNYRVWRVMVLVGVLGLWSADLAHAQRRVQPPRHGHGHGQGQGQGQGHGHVVRVLPRGHATVTVGGVRYHAVGATFYRPHARGFVVVPPPVGARLTVLPRGAVRVTRAGGVYYRHHGVHYRPVTARGATAFLVVRF